MALETIDSLVCFASKALEVDHLRTGIGCQMVSRTILFRVCATKFPTDSHDYEIQVNLRNYIF
jgi:hypothetical protein